MLPAQPPNSRRISGTRNATFSMCSLSGRMWVRKRSGNTMMVSYATDPQMSALLSLPGMPMGYALETGRKDTRIGALLRDRLGCRRLDSCLGAHLHPTY